MNTRMNYSLKETRSPRSSTSPGEKAMSTFLDFGTQNHTFASFQTMQAPPESHDSLRAGGIRVSLACVPCRSRHVKCGAEMPSCSRCVLDDKQCFYAKSRRGMRDRSASHKKASFKDQERASPIPGSHNIYNNDALPYPAGSSSSSFTANSAYSDASVSPAASTSPKFGGNLADPKRLLDLYYKFFHKAHPFALPRYSFLARLSSDPVSLTYLLPVMQYIGSLFAPEISSEELRESALSLLGSQNVPPNGFTVLALLLMGIATYGRDEFDRARSLLSRAIYMALEIRMNSRTFANMETDPVLAESWRRTYWGLYTTDAMLATTSRIHNFFLYTIETNVELPCEECDYEGVIPRPRTLSKYEARDFEDEEQVFSSFTYLIDISRISGTLFGIENLRGKDLEQAVASADAMLMNWKLHLPRQKQGVVDKNEDVDELLFQAHNLHQLLMITIHQPLSRLCHSASDPTASYAPLPTVQELFRKEEGSYWLHTRKCLEAAEIATNLYALPIPLFQHSPLGIRGIALSTLTNISACTYSLQGAEWYRTRDRVRLGLGGLKKIGEVWSTSERTERETKRIARSVFSMSRTGTENQGVHSGHGGQENNLQHGLGNNAPNFDFQTIGHELPGYEDLGGIDYLSMLDQQTVDQVYN